ncbi:MAG: T9SS type A sorting domain-containing protein, partial [Calditrichaeota bacterium]|nr:T9SS type A sorting domain-containing protein [Calditrichota bacterium]
AKANGSDLPAELPAQFELAQNYPNPFNPSTTIRFALPEAGHSVLRIYDNTGRLVKTLLSGYRNAGTYQVVWDATNDNGQRVASGMYLYRLVSGAHTQTRKMLLMR